MKKKLFDYTLTFTGILLAVAGLLLLKRYSAAEGVLLVLPYVLIGIGCGSFGHGMGNIISRKA